MPTNTHKGPPRIRSITYDNKSRKGTYIGIKYPGQRERHYKENQNVPIDVYLKATQEHWSGGQVRRAVQAWNKKPQKTRRAPPQRTARPHTERLSTKFKKGSTTAQYRLDQYQRRVTKNAISRKLYLPLLEDKRALGTIEKNITKLKNRHSYTLHIYGSQAHEEPHLIGVIVDIGRRTPEELYHLYHERLGYRNGELLEYGRIKSDMALLGLPKGSGSQWKGDAIISHVIVTARFQRG